MEVVYRVVGPRDKCVRVRWGLKVSLSRRVPRSRVGEETGVLGRVYRWSGRYSKVPLFRRIRRRQRPKTKARRGRQS